MQRPSDHFALSRRPATGTLRLRPIRIVALVRFYLAIPGAGRAVPRPLGPEPGPVEVAPVRPPLSAPIPGLGHAEGGWDVGAVEPVELVPDPRRARALLEAASWLDRAADPAAAARATEGALALLGGEVDAATWDLLARRRLAAGEASGAEAAWLEAAALSDPSDASPLLELGRLYAVQGRRVEAAWALGEARDRDPESPEALEALFAWVLAAPPPEPPPAEVDSAPPPAPPAPDWIARGRALAIAGFDSLRARSLDPLQGALEEHFVWLSASPAHVGLVALGAFVVLFVAPIWLRQRGDLAVALRYPEELRGTFRLRIARKRRNLRERISGSTPRTEILKGGTSSRTEHHLVSRETHFPRLLARRFFVLVEGILEDPDGGEVLSDVHELKVVRVRHRRTVRCEFDLRPQTAPVDVRVHWDGTPPRDVLIASDALTGPPVETASGFARLQLPKGSHTLVIGSGDRVLEREIEVRSFQPTPVQIDIAEAPGVVFRGCPPAVEPFLRGDFEAAARALDREGKVDEAHSVLARAALEANRLEEAAEHFRKARRPREAAELWEALGRLERAAELYVDADDPLRAARMYRAAGELVRAGEAYEGARDFGAAIECYKEAGEISKQVDALDRGGDTFAAAKIALDNGWRARGIRLLRLVSPQSPHFADACLLLADAFEREGHWDLAAQKIEEHINAVGSDGSSPDLQWRLSETLANAGHLERALSLLEELRRSEPTYPNLAARIEQLRKKRSTIQAASASGDGPRAGSGDFGPPTMFLSDQRYELLEEIGRGAMGVVFKGRDRRLSRVVALKRLPASLRNYPRAVQLFLREAQATARLNHPNIVTVYDADQEDGAFFITMELLEGQPLHVRLRDLGRLDPAEAMRIGEHVAEGLEYAHSRGVVHRDIKTANLFVTDDGVVKIMDFGLARMMEEVRRAETGIGGTPFYMAPEQVLGDEVDPRADLYSLGVTLFELVTGQVPFPDGDITYHHRHTIPPDARDLNPDVPSGLAELIDQLLSKSPDDRPPSADAVRERLASLRRQLDAEPEGTSPHPG